MTEPFPDLKSYFSDAETWSRDRERLLSAWQRRAWILAAAASLVAVFEAIALVALMPLKTAVPYTLLVDRQTGFVQALKPLDADRIAPDTALTRSFLAQYVIARAGYDIDSLKDDYRKVVLWSAGEARASYVDHMRASNAASPLAALPRSARIDVQIRGISSLNVDSALVRFTTQRLDSGAAGQPPQQWSAIVRFRFTTAEMSAADRLINPLGFQVVRYRQNAEIVPRVEPTPLPVASSVGSVPASDYRSMPRVEPR